jgi:nitrite reductase (NADH) small subunit
MAGKSAGKATSRWRSVCPVSELVPGSGVAALVAGRQLAIFYLPGEQPATYAIDNWDPVGKANVLARGVVGDIGGELVVASPLYKQHFSLDHGRCLEEDRCAVKTWSTRVVGGWVEVLA